MIVIKKGPNAWKDFYDIISQNLCKEEFGDTSRKRKYVPQQLLRDIMSPGNVKTLCISEPEDNKAIAGSTRINKLITNILKYGSQKTLAIAVYCRTPLRCIEELLSQEKYDSNLPFDDADCPGDDFKQKWNTGFLFNQYLFCAPNLKYKCYDKEFTPDCIIPIRYNEKDILGQKGASGSVYEIRIDKDYFDFGGNFSNDDSPLSPPFAMKVVKRTDAAAREKAFLIATADIDNTNIVKCYSAFHYDASYFMIYEKADMDLANAMNEKSPIQEKNWLPNQMLGLAKGLEAIHSIRGTAEKPESAGYIHDIKPTNILIFQKDKYKLKLADWGRAKVNELAPNENSHESEPKINPPYLPPESVGKGKLGEDISQPTSRPHDVWSLGCVYLEMVVWILDGPAELQTFRSNRKKEDEEENAKDEGFWNRNGHGFKLRSSVSKKVADLKLLDEDIRCLATVIEKMLCLDSTSRIKVREVVEALEEARVDLHVDSC